MIFGCKEEKKHPFSVIEVNVTNHQLLDSLIIYDKDMSWEIKSVLRFKESNIVIDTMNILENKLYQIYSFSTICLLLSFMRQDKIGTCI